MVNFWQNLLRRKTGSITIVPVPTGDIKIRDVPEDTPKFKREYTAKLTKNATVTITMRTYFSFSSKRDSSGELTQPDGRWILFNPDRVADKILDPVLVPLVKQYVKKIYEMDEAFIAGQPSEFTDEHKTIWRRVTGESK
jgi:hypothetical protein